MPTQPKVIHISRMSRHRRHHHHSSRKKKKRSTNVIHISSQSPQKIPSSSKQSFTHRSNPSMTQSSVHKPTNATSSSVYLNPWEDTYLHNKSTDHQQSMNSPKVSYDKKKLVIQSDETGVTQDHHRNKKKEKKCRRIILCVSLVAVLLVCIAIATTLGVLLSKKSTSTITPSSNAILRWNSTGITIAGIAGFTGVNTSLLNNPYGLAFDSSQNLYITDYKNHRIQKLIRGTTTPVTVAGSSNGTAGNTTNSFLWPVDVLLDSSDNMYITDWGNNRVQFWAKGATSGTTVAGINGTLNISLSGPSAIVSDSQSGTIFIADATNNRVVSYPAGTVVAGGNGAGNNNTQLSAPVGLAFESVSNSLLIPNFGTYNIVRWVLGATSRTLVAGSATGTSGVGSASLWGPVGVALDPMGNMYVADSFNYRIQLFMVGQTNATTIAGNGTASTSANQLNFPLWVALDNQLNLYVSDTGNNRVQKFLRY